MTKWMMTVPAAMVTAPVRASPDVAPSPMTSVPASTAVVPMRLEPVVYAGTSAVFFAILNAIKVIPYTALGQFDTSVLTTAAVLFPLAAASTWAGVRIVRRISTGLFYAILYVSIAVVAVKLVWDGVAGVLAG